MHTAVDSLDATLGEMLRRLNQIGRANIRDLDPPALRDIDITTAPLVLIGATSVIAQPFVNYALEKLNVVGLVDNATAGTKRGGLTVLGDEGLAKLIRARRDLVGVMCCCSDGAVKHFDGRWAPSRRPMLSLFQAARWTSGDMAPLFSLPEVISGLRSDYLWRELADETSQLTYLSILLHRLTWERAWIEPLRLPYKSMYFFTDAMAVGDDETLVDGGAFDGDTIELFVEKTAGRYRHIHAFEVDPANVDALTRRVAAVPRVTIHAKGLWRETAELTLSGGQGAASSLGGGEGGDSVPVTSLDSLDLGPVSFIKLDIEGAEAEALEGAAETIRRHKPKLSLAVYHKPNDLMDIMSAVKAIRGDYVFRLRHHSPIFHDTVLYAE